MTEAQREWAREAATYSEPIDPFCPPDAWIDLHPDEWAAMVAIVNTPPVEAPPCDACSTDAVEDDTLPPW